MNTRFYRGSDAPSQTQHEAGRITASTLRRAAKLNPSAAFFGGISFATMVVAGGACFDDPSSYLLAAISSGVFSAFCVLCVIISTGDQLDTIKELGWQEEHDLATIHNLRCKIEDLTRTKNHFESCVAFYGEQTAEASGASGGNSAPDANVILFPITKKITRGFQ